MSSHRKKIRKRKNNQPGPSSSSGQAPASSSSPHSSSSSSAAAASSSSSSSSSHFSTHSSTHSSSSRSSRPSSKFDNGSFQTEQYTSKSGFRVQFYSLWKRYVEEQTFRHRHAFRKFAAATLLAQKGELLRAFSKNRQVFLKLFNENPPLSEFGVTIVPLLKLLGDGEILNTAGMREEGRDIYGWIVSDECRFIDQALRSCLDFLNSGEQLSPAEISGEDVVSQPQCWEDIVEPIFEFLSRLFTQMERARVHSSASKWLAGLKEILNLVQTRNLCRTIKLQGWLKQIESAILPPAEEKKKQKEQLAQRVRATTSAAAATSSSAHASLFVTTEPPGVYREEGPRHDNDKEDFKEIRVLPTGEELLCPVEPYLPRAGDIYLPEGIEGQFARVFRLFREDMVTPLRQALQSDLLLQRVCRPENSEFARIRDPESGEVFFHFPHCQLVEVSPQLISTNRVCFSFPQPWLGRSTKRSATKTLPQTLNKRIKWWEEIEGRKYWQEGSVVVIFQRNHQSKFTYQLGVATGRDSKQLSYEEKIGRVFIDLPSLDSVSSYLQGGQIDLVQIGGHFFKGYEPILRGLQSLNPVSFPDFIPPASTPDNPISMTPIFPAYLNPAVAHQLDISPLLKKGTRSGGRSRLITLGTAASILEQLAPHRADIEADEGQLLALVHSLTHNVSLIAGPPGTGKSYLGVKLVQLLLHNRRAFPPQRIRNIAGLDLTQTSASITPIVCLCYTNHALDQFLEDLLDSGVKKLVRIGMRTKSERLEPLNMLTLSKQETLPRHLRKKEWTAYRDCDQIAETINELWGQLKELLSTPANKLEALLESQYLEDTPLGDFLFFLRKKPESQDGFKKQKAKPRKFLTKPGITALGLLLSRAIDVSETDLDEELDRLEDQGCERLSQQQRARLMFLYRQKFFYELMGNIRRQLKAHKKSAKALVEIRDQRKLEVLRKADVIGLTTTGAAMHQQLLKALSAPIIVVEEAGEVFESHILSALSEHTQHLIMIGDHQQLRPKCATYSLQKDSGRGYDLDVSLFERLILQQVPTQWLSVQRRMHPEISNLIRTYLYPNLIDDRTVEVHPPVKGLAYRLWFLDTGQHQEKQGNASSYENPFEAQWVASIVRHLILQGYKQSQITVITPYVGQLLLIKENLRKSRIEICLDDEEAAELEGLSMASEELLETENLEFTEIEKKSKKSSMLQNRSLHELVNLKTVDNFQGEESDVIILSTVRNNPKGNLGFLKSDNRVNVMVSRAKHGMIITGSEGTVLRSRKGNLFTHLVTSLRERNRIGNFLPAQCENHGTLLNIESPVDFERISPNGGCRELCNARLSCGHVCPKFCHNDNPKHVDTLCWQPCQRPRKLCQHPCALLCKDICGECLFPVQVGLSCGHTQEMPCRIATNPEALKRFKCQANVNRPLPLCGHPSQNLRCWKFTELDAAVQRSDWKQVQHILQTQKPCKQICGGNLKSCRHSCELNCSECVDFTLRELQSRVDSPLQFPDLPIAPDRLAHPPCSQVCQKDFFCGHRCEKFCHQGQGDCGICTASCLVCCVHSKCVLPCNELCPPCAGDCLWTCDHGQGTCNLPCSAPCIRLPCNRRCEKLLACGHQCPTVCGEVCPTDKRYCRLCSPQNSDVVDLIMQSSLADHNPDESPLVILSCGHALTIESGDGCFDLWLVYKTSTTDGSEWVQIRPFTEQSEFQPQNFRCPHCRKPSIATINRYGRVYKFMQFKQAIRRFSISCIDWRKQICRTFTELREQIDQLPAAKQRMLSSLAQMHLGFGKIEKQLDLIKGIRNLVRAKRNREVFSLASSSFSTFDSSSSSSSSPSSSSLSSSSSSSSSSSLSSSPSSSSPASSSLSPPSSSSSSSPTPSSRLKRAGPPPKSEAERNARQKLHQLVVEKLKKQNPLRLSSLEGFVGSGFGSFKQTGYCSLKEFLTSENFFEVSGNPLQVSLKIEDLARSPIGSSSSVGSSSVGSSSVGSSSIGSSSIGSSSIGSSSFGSSSIGSSSFGSSSMESRLTESKLLSSAIQQRLTERGPCFLTEIAGFVRSSFGSLEKFGHPTLNSFLEQEKEVFFVGLDQKLYLRDVKSEEEDLQGCIGPLPKLEAFYVTQALRSVWYLIFCAVQGSSIPREDLEEYEKQLEALQIQTKIENAIQLFQSAQASAQRQAAGRTLCSLQFQFILSAVPLMGISFPGKFTDTLSRLNALTKATLDAVKANEQFWEYPTQGEHAQRLFSIFTERLSLEEKKAVFAAMSREIGSNNGDYGNFGGHWFQCPNGHIYTIGECGGAMQTSRCPECGAPIGGANHQRLAGNERAEGFLREVQAI